MNNNKVVLGMSGGVDSTAAAFILKSSGYEVTGLFFDVLGNQQEQAKVAEMASQKLEMPFIYKDVSVKFKNTVIDNFISEYVNGRTPNPCVMCNKEIKYNVLIEEADRIGAQFVATGHYAKVAKQRDSDNYMIYTAKNLSKDQSYVLWRLDQKIVSRIIFPLGDIESKETIRDILRLNNFENAEKKDSQEICFIKGDDYIRFLQEVAHHKAAKGNFIDKQGNVLGKHKGIIHYTIGQRKGLGIALGKPAFVVDIDAEKNTVSLGNNEDLFEKTIKAEQFNFIGDVLKTGDKVKAKIRYASKAAEATIFVNDNNTIDTIFNEPQRAPTPGQSIVWYKEDMLIGGGIIG